MAETGYKFETRTVTGPIPAGMARDQRLSVHEFRVLAALALRLPRSRRSTATVAELASAASLHAQVVTAALARLAAKGYVTAVADPHPGPQARDAATEDGGGDRAAPPVRPSPSETTPPPARFARRSLREAASPPAPRPRLDARIMDRDIDLEALMRRGDARYGSADPAPAAAGGAGPRASRWNPVTDERAQPAESRFRVWLRFVLTPAEDEACRRLAAARPEDWDRLVARFDIARACGREAEFVATVRQFLGPVPAEAGGGAAGLRDAGAGS